MRHCVRKTILESLSLLKAQDIPYMLYKEMKLEKFHSGNGGNFDSNIYF